MNRDHEQEEREVGQLLARLDHPAPRVTFEEIASRAARRRSPRLRRVAAGVALVIGVGSAAYALPGSPLPRWVDQVLGWAAQVGRPAPTGDDVPGRLEPSLAGIAFAPPEDLLIRFESTHADGNVIVSLTGDATVAVRARHGAATFTAGDGIVVVRVQRSGATYEIDLPWSAPRVEIRMNGRTALLKEGSRLAPPIPEGASAVVLPMSPSGP